MERRGTEHDDEDEAPPRASARPRRASDRWGGISLLERAGVPGADDVDPDDAGSPAVRPTTLRAAHEIAEPPPHQGAAATPTPVEPPATTERRPSRVGPAHDPWAGIEASEATSATLRSLDVHPADVAAAPVPADELVGWLWHRFEVDEIHRWLPFGAVRTAAKWRDAGFGPREAAQWKRVTDDPDQARRLRGY